MNEYRTYIFPTQIQTHQNVLHLSWTPLQPFVKHSVNTLCYRQINIITEIIHLFCQSYLVTEQLNSPLNQPGKIENEYKPVGVKLASLWTVDCPILHDKFKYRLWRLFMYISPKCWKDLGLIKKFIQCYCRTERKDRRIIIFVILKRI